MITLKDQILCLRHRRAATKAADLAGQYPLAEPQEKEVILARLKFEKWLTETCQMCLDRPERSTRQRSTFTLRFGFHSFFTTVVETVAIIAHSAITGNIFVYESPCWPVWPGGTRGRFFGRRGCL